MALKKQNSGKSIMSFGEHRDLGRIVTTGEPARQKRVNVNFDEDKHIRLKAACARRGTSISDVIKELVDKWLTENE